MRVIRTADLGSAALDCLSGDVDGFAFDSGHPLLSLSDIRERIDQPGEEVGIPLPPSVPMDFSRKPLAGGASARKRS